MLQQLVEKAGREYRTIREHVEDVRYGVGEIGYRVANALEDIMIRFDFANYYPAEILEATREFTPQATAGYREAKEAMGNIRSFLAQYDPIDSSTDDKIRMGGRLIEQLEAIKSNITREQETAEVLGIVAYFMTHPKDHTLFCAIDTFYF